MKRLKTYAKVQITVEVDLDSPWGEDTNVSKIHETAKREAVQKLEQLLPKGVRIMSVANVKAIIVEED